MANNTEYRLQLRSCKTLFPTREAALNYLEKSGGFKYGSKFGEPVLMFYGSVDEPKMIIVVGSTQPSAIPSYCYIDDAEIRELVNEAVEKANAAQEEADKVEDVLALLMNTIDASGLTYDDNKIVNKVSYDPPGGDPLIGNADTIAEAVALISARVNMLSPDIQVHVRDTSTVKMVNDNGTISSDVKIHKVDTTIAPNDDNIIGVVNAGENGGIAASVDISFDDTRNTIVFKKSGVVNGEYKVDAKVVEIALPDANVFDHAEYDAENKVLKLYFTNGQVISIQLASVVGIIDVKNDPESSVVLTKDSNSLVSGDIKRVDSPSNLLERGSDGRLFVDGDKIALKTEVANLDTRVNEKITQEVAQLNHTIDDVYASLHNDDVALGNRITQEVAQLNHTIDDVYASLHNDDVAIGGRVTSVEGRVTSVEDSVSGLNGRLGDAEQRVGAVEGGVRAVEDSVGSLDGRVSAIEGEKVNFATKVELEAKQNNLVAGDAIDITGDEISVKTINDQQHSDNMVRVVNDSLYANIVFEVDELTNSLKYKTSGMESWNTLPLPGVRVVDDIEYDPDTHILKIDFTEGESVNINLGDLVNVVVVPSEEQQAQKPVKLNMSTEGGVSTISAEFDAEKIVTPNGPIVVGNNMLYMDAKKLTQNRTAEQAPNMLKYDDYSNTLYVDPDSRIDGLIREVNELKQTMLTFVTDYSEKIDRMFKTLYGEPGVSVGVVERLEDVDTRLESLEDLVGKNFVDFADQNGDNVIDESDYVYIGEGSERRPF